MRIIPVVLTELIRFAHSFDSSHWYYPTISTLAHSLRSFTGSFAFSSHRLSLILLLSSLSFASFLNRLYYFSATPFFHYTKKFIYFFLSTNKKFIIIFSTPLIKNSYTFQFFQLHNKIFVYKILGQCSGAEQLPDQMFG